MNSSELKGYLTGLIFGDGHIDKGVTKRSFSIKSTDINFINKIYNDLSCCNSFNITIKDIPAHYSSGCNHKECWELTIKACPYFAKKYHWFYNDTRQRIASKEALKSLNEVGLANWFMSDGYTCLVGKVKGVIKNRRIDICTDRYDLITVQHMQTMLKNKFNLHTSIIKRTNSYRIRIKLESYETFFWLIYNNICDSMKYKLYLGYEMQPKWMSDAMWLEQQKIKNILCSAATQN